MKNNVLLIFKVYFQLIHSRILLMWGEKVPVSSKQSTYTVCGPSIVHAKASDDPT